MTTMCREGENAQIPREENVQAPVNNGIYKVVMHGEGTTSWEGHRKQLGVERRYRRRRQHRQRKGWRNCRAHRTQKVKGEIWGE